MENFNVQIKEFKRNDAGQLIIAFDVFVGGIKMGEAEQDYTVFNGSIMEKFHAFIANSRAENLQSLIASLNTPV